ncbi:MAG TPA: hypothetical protein IGQ15_05960 [Thermosynechococcus sp. M98_K2018_005]|uniref:capsular polysaccharide export protein, LipB/KpsS family n=1 Tax=Thermosynechococcus sp. M98_K2018_005 TaxID=2747811 RepID=UPI0019DD02BA|nr:hypothetical protein [Thermosynechococcus sp. M98_K2018_005]HIK35224.1 hypothetical protein [Thermosynechococcus sp. M98_K2018_005]
MVLNIKDNLDDRYKLDAAKQQNIENIIITSISAWPHLEIACEIALNYNKAGHNTALVFIHDCMPDQGYFPYLSHPIISLPIRSYYWNRVKYLFGVLNQKNVNKTFWDTPDWTKVDLLWQRLKKQVDKCTNLEEISQVKLDENINIGLGVASSYCSRFSDPNADLKESYWIEAYFKSAISMYLSTDKVINLFQPKNVIVFNGRTAYTRPVVETCQKHGVQVLYYEFGATLNHYYISPYSPHDLRVTRLQIQQLWQSNKSDQKITIAKSFFLRKSKGEDIGNFYSFVQRQKKNLIPKKCKTYRWTYYSSSDDELFFVDPSFINYSIFKSQAEAIEWLIEYVDNLDDIELVIRVHPHKDKKSKRLRDYWNNLQGKNILVVKSNSPVDSYELARTSDLVITYASTMGIEAAYLGKPVILIGDAAYKGLDCVYEPSNVEELKRYLSLKELTPKPVENTLPFGYFCLNHYTTQGTLRSYEITTAVDKILILIKKAEKILRNYQKFPLLQWIN